MVELTKTQYPGFKKDKKHNVVINTDIRQYEEYTRQVAKSKQFNKMADELASLKELVNTLIQQKASNV